MSSMINYGIDLGTSNSLIARFDKGQVEVFKNPNGFKETLPSVVGFRNDRILVGDQARSYSERDPKSVVSRFKRKMGTSETFKIKSLGSSKSPVELSSYVLKELKGFVHSGDQVEGAVITIPASFDTVQSNATKEAGTQAGFRTVVLLQEPIAASLAYANKEKGTELRNSQWLVYDLGGGTFDVALIHIVEGDLRVVDHEGDNFLGGTDFDALIVEKIIAPELEKRGTFGDLLAQMKSESGRYNQLWHSFLRLAEEAKVELSSKTAAEIDLGRISDLKDDEGRRIDDIITITRSEFDALLKDAVDRTIDMMRQILTRNSLQPSDVKFILMVGGSTYIPYVRKRVEESMQISVNTSIDPTNAIAVGAAYFAGSKEMGKETRAVSDRSPSSLKIRASYARASQESEETFSAKIEGATGPLNYRIVRDDGAYDSGIKKLGDRIVEDLPLREGAFNTFSLRIFDSQGNAVPIDIDQIQIAQGRYSVAGQMLPEDICLVADDLSAKDTRLIQLFSKNAVLPSRAKRTVEVAKTIVKGSGGDIQIIVVEGPSTRHSSTNKPIGILSVTGKQISRDLIKGTEIDLSFELSESRDLTVSAYLNGTDQNFREVFSYKQRSVSPRMLASEILLLESKVQTEIDEAESGGHKESVTGLERVLQDVQSLVSDAASLGEDDVTDRKFQLEDVKRRLAQEVFELTSSKRLEQAKAAYYEARAEVSEVVQDSGNDREKHTVSEIVKREQTFINSSNPEKIQTAVMELERIRWQILVRKPEFLTNMLKHLIEHRPSMNDQVVANQLIESGKRAVNNENWEELRQINGRLWDLMPSDAQASDEMRIYTGIV